MKNLAKFFVPVAVAAIALVSCQKEVNNDVATPLDGITITVKAGAESVKADAETKTYLGTYNDVANTVLWGTGEYMKLALTAGEETTFANSTADNADAWDGKNEAYFEFNVSPATASSYVYQGIYPASVAVTSSNTNPASYKVVLPSAQNATASTYDPAAYIMVAKPETFDAVQTEWTASFRRATALNKITLKGLNDDITSVKFTLPEGTAFAGRRYIDLTSGESGNIYSGENEIEVLYATAIPANEGGDKVIWFTSWGVELAEGAEITIVAKSATKSYTKTITARSTGIKFKEGYLNTLGISMSGITGEDLADYSGDYLIGTYYTDKWSLMSSTCSSNVYVSTATDVSEAFADVDYTDFVYEVETNSYIWHVVKTANGYTIQSNDTNKYLSYSGSSNQAHAADEIGSATYFDFEVASSGVATIASKNVSGRYLRYNYNGGNPRFAFYTSGQQDIYLIPATVDNRTAVTLSFDEDAIELTTANCDEFTGQDLTADPNETAITNNLTWSYEDEDGIIDDFNNGTLSFTGEVGTATVTVTFAGDETYRPATASYTIMVTSATAPKWVKTDIANIAAGSAVVIVDLTTAKAMANTGGTSSAPAATAVTLSADQSQISGTPDASIQWILGKSGSNYTFNVSGTSNYLYIYKNDNNGLRVGTGERNTFEAYDNNGVTFLHNLSGTDHRYLGVYNSQDWRCYTSINNNIKNTVTAFYTLEDTREFAPISWSEETATAYVGQSFTAPTLSNTAALTVTYDSSDESVATISAAGAVTILAEGTTTISATFTAASTDTYKTTTVEYELTVEDNRETVATPTFSPAAGEVAENTVVTISTTTAGATIYYTTDASAAFSTSTWTQSSTVTIDAAKTIRAVAVKDGYKNSEEASAAYTIAGAVTATLQYTLSGTTTGSGSAYADAHEVTQNNIAWQVTGNVTQDPWRIGGKVSSGSSAVDRAIYSTNPISANISSIEVTSGTANVSSVNSLTITVHSTSTDAENGTNAIATKTVTSGITSSTVTLAKEDNTSWAGKYYRIVYNVTLGTSNKYVEFVSAKFYGVAVD